MNWINRQILKFRKKSPLQKALDLLFIAFVVLMLFPAGRIGFQRAILFTGLFDAGIEAEDLRKLPESVFDQFVFLDSEGVEHSLAEYKGQVIFVNFWATWCPPCRAELPSLENMYDEMKNEDGVTFLFLSYESKQKVENFAKEFGTKLPFGYLTYKVPAELDPPGLPTTFVIDKNGNLAHQTTGMANWDSESFMSELQELINE